jgi:predicted membrane protein
VDLLSLAAAVTIMVAGTLYPPLMADAAGKVDHGLAMALLWAMSAGFVRGVGIVPRAAPMARQTGVVSQFCELLMARRKLGVGCHRPKPSNFRSAKTGLAMLAPGCGIGAMSRCASGVGETRRGCRRIARRYPRAVSATGENLQMSHSFGPAVPTLFCRIGRIATA